MVCLTLIIPIFISVVSYNIFIFQIANEYLVANYDFLQCGILSNFAAFFNSSFPIKLFPSQLSNIDMKLYAMHSASGVQSNVFEKCQRQTHKMSELVGRVPIASTCICFIACSFFLFKLLIAQYNEASFSHFTLYHKLFQGVVFSRYRKKANLLDWL